MSGGRPGSWGVVVVAQSCGGVLFFGVDHVACVAKEIDIDFVVNNFIPLSTKGGTH